MVLFVSWRLTIVSTQLRRYLLCTQLVYDLIFKNYPYNDTRIFL
jgi:hypothetical protein